jgi:hypothetical protein
MAFHSWYDVANACFWWQTRDGYFENMRGFELISIWDFYFDRVACWSDVVYWRISGEEIAGCS